MNSGTTDMVQTPIGAVSLSVLATNAFILCTGYLISILFAAFFVAFSIPLSLGILLIGALAWTAIYFFAFLPWCLKWVPDNEVWIVANSFIQEIVPSGGPIQRERPIRAQRALQSGFNLTLAWEYVALGGVIKMTKQPLKNEEGHDTYTSSDNAQFKLEYKAYWSAIPGFEINYFRFNNDGRGAEDIAQYLRGVLRAYLQEFCSRHTKDQLKGSLQDINAAIQNIFFQGRELHETEKTIGAQITNCIISRVEASKSLEQVMQSKQDVLAISEAADELQTKYGFPSEKAFEYALIAAGKEGVTAEMRTVDEKINFSGLPKNLGTFVHSPGGGGSGKGGNPNRGGGKNRGGQQQQGQGQGQNQGQGNNRRKNRGQNKNNPGNNPGGAKGMP